MGVGEREGGRGGERSTRGRGREGRTSSSARGLLAAAAANEPRSLTRCARDAGIVPALARVSVCARACVHAFVRSCTRVRAYMQALPLCVGCMWSALALRIMWSSSRRASTCFLRSRRPQQKIRTKPMIV